jgi:hypothetical protein
LKVFLSTILPPHIGHSSNGIKVFEAGTGTAEYQNIEEIQWLRSNRASSVWRSFAVNSSKELTRWRNECNGLPATALKKHLNRQDAKDAKR